MSLRISVDLLARQAVLEVRDEGRGIEASLRPRVFDRFFTTENPRTGLRGTGRSPQFPPDLLRNVTACWLPPDQAEASHAISYRLTRLHVRGDDDQPFHHHRTQPIDVHLAPFATCAGTVAPTSAIARKIGESSKGQSSVSPKRSTSPPHIAPQTRAGECRFGLNRPN